MSHNTENYNEQGGDKKVIRGEISIDGGKITEDGTQASAISDHADTSAATAEEVAEKQNDILAALRGVGIIAEQVK